jgi:hypothetical protein
MKTRAVIYVLKLQSTGGDDIRGLRWILKILLRRYGFKCIEVREEA